MLNTKEIKELKEGNLKVENQDVKKDAAKDADKSLNKKSLNILIYIIYI